MRFPAIAQMDGYWEALRGDRPMPNRSEVDPRGLEQALEFAFLAEMIAPGVARLRVAGMHLNGLLGMEVRGMPLTAFVCPPDRARLSLAVRAVIETPQVAQLELAAERGIGRPALAARLYMAPLASDRGGAPRLIGCLQSEGVVGRAPRRFGIDAIRTRALGAQAASLNAPSVAQESNMPGFAERAAPFEAAPEDATPRRGRPVLRLVKND